MFPIHGLRVAVLIYMGFLGATTVILLCLDIFQCVPVRAVWDLEARKHAKCLTIDRIAYGAAAVEIITEVALFALPIPIVSGLQLAGSKKAQLYIFFGSGLL